ncbi:unnamed protein product [Dibothriocephalus latus]|uniref:Uncharacterized protein n=1 Tax=Dibothriocephalus latus TaxID=60516 RepID=A0A3P7LYL6_DIBLA|nr:unnamed protein product [Dibothriocephalus latus]
MTYLPISTAICIGCTKIKENTAARERLIDYDKVMYPLENRRIVILIQHVDMNGQLTREHFGAPMVLRVQNKIVRFHLLIVQCADESQLQRLTALVGTLQSKGKGGIPVVWCMRWCK